VVAAGGCAAAMRTAEQWALHPQGQALAAEPIVDRRPVGDSAGALPSARADAAPLAGVRVLDLTRVIAGPVCTRVLAAYGADVVRIDPPGFAEVEALLGDTTAGKRRTALDLRAVDDRRAFEQLVQGADVIVHGYRSDALAALGYDGDRLQALRPGLIVTTHDAYGWSGPWRARRGFDSLVQMSVGIAARGQEVMGAAHPFPLPAQALDHATGYLLAAATARALADRGAGRPAYESRLSLARTAKVLTDLGERGDPSQPDLEPAALEGSLEEGTTAFGPVRRVSCPGRIDGIEPRWTIPAGPLGIDPPTWSAGG
jgi:hypothetical protein